MSNVPSLTHRSGHPLPPPTPSSQILAEAQGRSQSRNLEHFRNSILPQRAPGALASPAPTPYPEAQRARLPGEAGGLSYVKDLVRKRARIWGTAERESGQTGRGLQLKKAPERQKSPGRRQRNEGVVELVLLEKLLGTPKVISKVRPPFGGGTGGGVLEEGQSGARCWV